MKKGVARGPAGFPIPREIKSLDDAYETVLAVGLDPTLFRDEFEWLASEFGEPLPEFATPREGPPPVEAPRRGIPKKKKAVAEGDEQTVRDDEFMEQFKAMGQILGE
jgi:hypothetical protein